MYNNSIKPSAIFAICLIIKGINYFKALIFVVSHKKLNLKLRGADPQEEITLLIMNLLHTVSTM